MAEIPANMLTSTVPGANGAAGGAAFNVALGRRASKSINFTHTLGASAWPAGTGIPFAVGPKFTKNTYTLPASATWSWKGVASSNTVLYNVNESDQIAYTTLLQLMSEVPNIISQLTLTFSEQADIGGNALVLMQRDLGSLDATEADRIWLRDYFRPADFQNTTTAWVTLADLNLGVNEQSFLYLESAISVNTSLKGQIFFRAAGGATSLMNPVATA